MATASDDRKQLTVLLSGGGTGGHIMPLLALAAEIRKREPSARIVYIGERQAKFKELVDTDLFDESYQIFAGKFRRYHGESWLRRLFDIKTWLLNIRDFFYFLIGLAQCLWLVPKIMAHVTLLKGGFTGVPVGLASALFRRPYVTHDSDAVAGLANRLVAKWAKLHATGSVAAHYPYPEAKIHRVGVLVEPHYQPVSKEKQRDLKQQLKLPVDQPLLLITGGSGGAATLNKALRMIVSELLERWPNLQIIHQVGKGKTGVYDGLQHDRLAIHELLLPMYVYSGASDVVVTRAGANTMAQFGVQGKACIVVPNPLLTGGHQLKNAQVWAKQGAILLVNEDQLATPEKSLLPAIETLLSDKAQRQRLGKALQDLTIADATEQLTTLLLEVAEGDERDAQAF